MRRLTVHIGAPKCGSTYLQRVLLQNRARLASAGIAYPHDGAGHPGNGLAVLDSAAAWLKEYDRNIGHLVLSHEDLFAAPAHADRLAQICGRERIDVQVIAFLRPFSSFIFGDYSQFIKQHLDQFLAAGRAFDGRGFEQFAVDRAHVLNAAGFLRGWMGRLPRNPPVIASHAEIRSTIERVLDSPGLDWQIGLSAANPSLRMQDCDSIVRAINAGCDAASVRLMLRDALLQTQQPDAGKTPERIAWLEALFHRQNTALLQQFGYDNRR